MTEEKVKVDMTEEAVFDVMDKLRNGIDITVDELACLKESNPDLIELLGTMWENGDSDRKATRCGTLYLEEGAGGRSVLSLRLRFPVDPSDILVST